MRAPAWADPVELVGDGIAVTVLVGKGADVRSFVDLRTGVDVLFAPPWDPPADPSPPAGPLDEAQWLARYLGGWQLLLPHAGPPVGGRGYHGAASVAAWTIRERTPTTLTVTVDLPDPALTLERRFELRGPGLDVATTVRNTGAADVPVSWVEHPVFGTAFVDEHTSVRCGAATLLPADGTGPDDPADALRVPAADTTGRRFATLTDLAGGWYEIDSPTAGFAVRVEWDPQVLPHAWYWQEWGATTGFPWYGEAFALAIEPSNVPAGSPEAAPVLAAGSTWTSAVRMSRHRLPGAQGSGAGVTMPLSNA